MAKIHFYKRNQGKYTRMITLVSVLAIAATGAYLLGARTLVRMPVHWRFGIPLAVVLAVGLGMLWIINRPSSADFLIATEGEMKKVSWSSRKEVIGSTKVVIVTTLIMAAVLFAVDMVFAWAFNAIGVMGGQQ
ncbi:MAG: preprotein translocase subunit SecE [Phycisphaerae bacterium]